jgi:hypothetical protein
MKFPANFQMPPHTHPYSEVVTIISGAIETSQGEKSEKKRTIEAGRIVGVSSKTRALRMDRQRRSGSPSSISPARKTR